MLKYLLLLLLSRVSYAADALPAEATKYTYSASSVFSFAASGTDIFTITGSNTKTIRVTKLLVTGQQTTGGTALVYLVKRSTANTGGTSSTLTAVPYDSTNPTATATVRRYTANPTLGAMVGTLFSSRISLVNNNNNVMSKLIDYDFSDKFTQGVTLRGTSQVLAVNFNGVTHTGNSMAISVEWIEE